MRVSDANKRRKLRYSQAILLGCVFDRSKGLWFVTTGVRTRGVGGRYGAWEHRHQAVDWILAILGVLK
jgi:hypothetical protein